MTSYGTVSTAAAAATRRVAAEHASDVDSTGRFPHEVLAMLRESGLLGLLVPREYGGIGGELRDLVEVTARIAEGCLSSALIFAMHCQQVEVLVRHANHGLRARLLPQIAEGEKYLASVTSEAGTRGLFSCNQELVPDGPDHQLRRDAPVVTGGRHADGFLVTMRASPDATRRQISLVYADQEQLRTQVGQPWTAMGMRGVENVSMNLSGRVPGDQIIGPPGDFGSIAVETFAPTAHLGWSAAWLGAARGAYGELVRLIRRGDRVRVDPRSELVLHRLARTRIRLEVVSGYLAGTLDEVLALRAERRSLSEGPVQIHLNTLKVLAADETFLAANEMLELAGLRTGYLQNSRPALERLVRDLRSAALNHDNSRLLISSGALCLLDPAVGTLGTSLRSDHR